MKNWVYLMMLVGILINFGCSKQTNPVTEDISAKLDIEMAAIPQGTFIMGDVFDGMDDQKPTHSVTLIAFRISKTEVTQKQWFAIMGTKPSQVSGDSLPVDKVSWYDAISFCNKLSTACGLKPCYSINGYINPNDWTSGTIVMSRTGGYRLPTEAEWEYAAGGGVQKTRWSGTNDSTALQDYAWYSNYDGFWPHMVGKKRPNNLGLYDMSGSVREWCWDWYSDYSAEALTDPTGPATGTFRVYRGGCWLDANYLCTTTIRDVQRPVSAEDFLGFRIAKD